MAIYQPTNIIPSTFAGVGGGVIDAGDNVSISWQVNGNSPMTGFSVAVYQNDADSTVVHTATISTLSPAFDPTDALGNPQTYTYAPSGVTWANWGLSNGNGYKLAITQNWSQGGSTQSVAQNSESVFIARAKPTLSISPSSATVSNVAQTFTGTYAQAQGDAVSWAHWVLTDSAGNVIDDTGTVYTGVLSYTFNRFFNGVSYTLSCTVETENGVEVSDSVSFAVSYTTPDAVGEMQASCNPDDSVTLTWAGATSVPATANPSTGWGTAEDGELSLASGATVTWDNEDGTPFSVAAPYAAAWKGKVGSISSVTGTGSVSIPADKAPNKTYPGTGTATDTVTADSMTKVPKNDLTGTDTLSLPVTTSKYLDSQITYSGSPSFPPPGSQLVEIFSDELNPLGFTLYVFRGTGGIYRAYLEWTSYFEPISVTRLSGATYDDLRTTTATDENGTTIYNNQLFSPGGVYNYGNSMSVLPFTLKIRYRYYQYSGTYTPAHDGLNSISITSMDPALRASGEPFAPQIKTTVSDGDGTFNIEAVSGVSGTYPLGVQYKYAYEGVGAYEGTYSGVFDAELPPVTWERGQLKSVSVVSVAPNAVGATASATVTVGSNNAYTVKFTSSAAIAPSATIQFTYNSPTTGADSYWITVTVTLPANATSGLTAEDVTTDATGGFTIASAGTNKYKITFKDDGANAINYSYTYQAVGYAAGSAIELYGTGTPSSASLSWAASSGSGAVLTVSVNSGGSVAGTFSLPVGAWTVLFALKKPLSGKCVVTAYSWDRNNVQLATKTYSKTGLFPTPVTSVSLTGEQTCYFVTLTKDPNASFVPQPDWTRLTVFFARFYGSLEGGTLAAGSALGLMIYRETDGELAPVGLLGTTVSSITDYGIRSGQQFRYVSYYVTNGAYSTGMTTDEFCRLFRQYTLIEAEQDENDVNTYHPVNVWRFNSNVDAGAYSSTNAPVLLDNFTPYPVWQPSSRTAKSGTLTAMLSLTADGQYQGTDTADAMEKLFGLARSRNPLFYRDPKGNLYMVQLSGAITQTIDNNNAVRPVTVSVPWIEVGDASEAMIYKINEVASGANLLMSLLMSYDEDENEDDE